MGFELGTSRSQSRDWTSTLLVSKHCKIPPKYVVSKTQGCATPTCTKPSNVHVGHAICHTNVFSRHAKIQVEAHVCHEIRGLISMTDMQYDCARRCLGASWTLTVCGPWPAKRPIVRRLLAGLPHQSYVMYCCDSQRRYGKQRTSHSLGPTLDPHPAPGGWYSDDDEGYEVDMHHHFGQVVNMHLFRYSCSRCPPPPPPQPRGCRCAPLDTYVHNHIACRPSTTQVRQFNHNLH